MAATEWPVGKLARLAGALYLVIIAMGMTSQLAVRDAAIVPGNAAETAARLAASEHSWRLSIAGELVMLACAIALVPIFYALFRPVSKRIAMFAVAVNVVSIALEVGNKLQLLSASFLTGGASYLGELPGEYRHVLAYHAVRLHEYGYGVNLVYFGLFCLAVGWLIVRGGFLPRVLGWMMALAGACYVVNTYALLLSPPLHSTLYPLILVPCFLGEAALCAWLLVKGVDQRRWESLSAAPGSTAAA